MSDKLPDTLKDTLVHNYGLNDLQDVKSILAGLENQNYLLTIDDQVYFLQISNTSFQPQLFDYKTKLLNWLTLQGITECIEPIPTSDDNLFCEVDSVGSIILYPFRPQLHPFHTDPETDQQAGTNLANWVARLHNLTAQAPAFVKSPKGNLQENFQTLKAYYPLFEKFGLALASLPLDDETKDAWRDFLVKTPHYYHVMFDDDRVFRLLESTVIHTTLVHDDLNLSNLSFDDFGSLVTVYDFDNARLDNRVADLQFLYYYYYHPSSVAGQDWFDNTKFKQAIAAYNSGGAITSDEKRLCAMLGMDRSLRGLLWMFDMLTKGVSPALFSAVDYRVRPHDPTEEGTSAFQTFAKLFNGIEFFSDTERYLSFG